MTSNSNTSPPPSKKWCVLSAVGKNSTHRTWLNEDTKFDLHLIVYDESYEKYKSDTPYISQSKGYKFQLVHEYLKENEAYLDHYQYTYIPDDDIIIKPKFVHRLFGYMERYNLEIAQPALANEHYTFSHTLKRFNSKLRYTNFVEIMQPCFSKNALKKVFFTFRENKSGWGIDFHWGQLIDYQKRNMAIIDDVMSIHSRPVQSNHREELLNYLEKYNLTTEIYETI